MDDLSIPERLPPTEPAGSVGSNDAPTGDGKRHRRKRSSSSAAESEESVNLPDDENTHEVDELA